MTSSSSKNGGDIPDEFFVENQQVASAEDHPSLAADAAAFSREVEQLKSGGRQKPKSETLPSLQPQAARDELSTMKTDIIPDATDEDQANLKDASCCPHGKRNNGYMCPVSLNFQNLPEV